MRTDPPATAGGTDIFDSALELEASRNLNDTVQATPADRVRRSDLTERRTVDVEDRIARSVQAQPGRKHSSQKVSVVQNVECIRADLEPHPFSQPNALGQRHVELGEHWTIDRAPRQRAELTGTIVEENLARKRRLPERRRSATIRVNHRRIDVIDNAVLIENADQVADLSVRETRDNRLVCGSADAVQRPTWIDDRQRRAGVDTQNSAQLPTSYHSIDRAPTIIQKRLPSPER